MDVHVTPDNLLFELSKLRTKNNSNASAASETFKPLVQYYYVVLCEFESERKWIRRSSSQNWKFLTQVLLIRRANTFFWYIYKKEDTLAWIDLSIDNTIFLLL